MAQFKWTRYFVLGGSIEQGESLGQPRGEDAIAEQPFGNYAAVNSLISLSNVGVVGEGLRKFCVLSADRSGCEMRVHSLIESRTLECCFRCSGLA